MDKISEALADQLTATQNLDQGLLMNLSFYEELKDCSKILQVNFVTCEKSEQLTIIS